MIARKARSQRSSRGPGIAARAGTLTILAAVSALFGCGSASHDRHTGSTATTRPPAGASYSALLSSSPSGIAVVSLAHAQSVVHTPARPIWVRVQTENAHAVLPSIETAREVRHVGVLRAWISRSDAAGVCLLAFDPATSPTPTTDHTVTASCGVARELDKGLALALQSGREQRWLVLGVVPDGVPQVEVVLADGSARATRVTHNSYSVEVDGRVKEVSFERNGVRQQVNI
jgi:hypothetical protein